MSAEQEKIEADLLNTISLLKQQQEDFIKVGLDCSAINKSIAEIEKTYWLIVQEHAKIKESENK